MFDSRELVQIEGGEQSKQALSSFQVYSANRLFGGYGLYC